MLKASLLGAVLCGVVSIAVAAQEAYYPGNGVTLPTVTKEVHLLGPVDARIGIDCVVDETGKVATATVVDTPDPALNNAAIRALRQWQFQPGTMNSRPVAVRIFVQISVERL